MQRRKFLTLASLSSAGFLFKYSNASTGRQFNVMRLPNTVAVRCNGQWFILKGGSEHWKSENIEVDFAMTDNVLSLEITAPNRELELIQCSWSEKNTASSKLLNDHLERSYGDLSWQQVSTRRRSPWYILIADESGTRAFGVKTGANSICYWQATPNSLDLILDTHSGGMGVLLGDRKLHAADIITTENLPGENPYHTDVRFCGMMCPDPVLPTKPVYGINDWYFAYGNNSRALILDRTGSMAELVTNYDNLPFSVIDDGWSVKPKKSSDEYCWGDDYTKGNEKFGDMSAVAANIKKLGMRPGIWTRPLLANANDPRSSLIPIRPGQKNEKERFLDPTIPENLDRAAKTISLYKNWGYDLVKQDYSSYDLFGRWGFEMSDALTVPGWHFQDRSKTNAEIILLFYNTLRKAAGSMYLIGCNTFSHLSAGIFEINRIGDDTSGNEWARTLKMGVNTLGFRLPQHNRFYAADGDCVGLTTKIPWSKNKQWLHLLAESSAPLFISAEPQAIGTEQKNQIRKSFELASKIQPLAEPLDWMNNPRPEDWVLNGQKIHFDWNA